ncbi:MAG: dephospho-CoA kinase [Candidatus Nitricoxidivorans perseverans]|uniref:Dephospho-CoA kinase n=1 Tax=Candidatus Nitricoxidivorans perseverans TaxID=2975601 RepID=A0AA49FKC4_9PROT|nr:MAG: dephospho-CoA kinase [Candidatus Nitricoxidivorans perseverans]
MIVGLTGGIGSGKSVVADGLAGLGAAVVDTDAIAHALTGPGGAAMAAIRAAFGETVVAPDGRLDRAVMRRLTFADADVRTRLEGILHPLIRAEGERRCRDALAGGAPYVVLVVPLLAESGSEWRQRVDRIAVVDCDDEARIARVMIRSGLSRDEVAGIMAAQAGRDERLAIADDVIDNGGDLAALYGRVGALHRQYCAMVEKGAAD